MRRCLRSSGLILPVRRPHAFPAAPLLVRSYGWNPFIKKVSLEEEGTSSSTADTKEVVMKVKQELRKPLQFEQLNSLLVELTETSPNKDSFVLINEILRKLEQRQFNTKTPVNTQFPPISTDIAYKLFKTVIDHIDRANFKSARFVPRLYLQLTQVATTQQNKSLLIQVFTDFIRYLSILGYEEQLVKVVNSFVVENDLLKESAIVSVVNTLKIHHPTPSLTLQLLELFNNKGVSSINLAKLHQLVIQSIDHYLSQRNELYAIDQQNLYSIQKYIQNASQHSKVPESIYHLLKLCHGRDFLQHEESTLLTTSINYLLNNKDYKCKNQEILKIYIDSIIQNSVISYDERKIVGNIMLESFKKQYNDEISKDIFDLYVKWDVFTNSTLSEPTQSYLLQHKDLVDENTYKDIVASMSFSSSSSFNESMTKIYKFFETNFPNFDKTIEIHSLLLKRGIRLNDATFLKQKFTESIDDGISWDSGNPKVLYDFIYILANEPNANVKQVFKWYEKIKIFVKYLDSKSYNSLMKLFLENELIGDAIESLKMELPPLPDEETKYSVDQYPELFQSMYEWILEYRGDPEVSWTVYGELQKYFHVPYDTYFPLMKKFISLKRPDAAFMIFQKLKRVHRTTGSIPPPTPEMYCYLFKMFGEDLYEEGVKHLHIIMKLDLQLNTDINVMNSLLGAYCDLQEFFRTQETFDSIISMPKGKGINHETITIMLKSYTYVSLNHVKSFWDNIYQYNILPNEDNYKQYIIAHCYHEKYDLALQIASEIEEFDLMITPEIIKSLYNWTQGEEDKLKVEEWASKNHKLIWNNIKKDDKLVTISNVADNTNENGFRDIDSRLVHESSA